VNLRETVEINKKVMALIKSKYPDVFPLGYNNPDATYYNRLDEDNIKGERYLSYSKKKVPTP